MTRQEHAAARVYVGDPVTPEILHDLTRGATVMVNQLGTIVPHELGTDRQREAFTQAQKRGYVVRRGAGDLAVSNCLYLWAALRNMPYVEVRPHKRYASVEVDFFRVTPAGEALRDAAESCIRSYPFASDWERGALSRFTLGAVYWCADGWPVEHAERLAAELVRIVAVFRGQGGRGVSA